ncbi:DUF6279 family lipoprotein [Polaromonas sp.]|uniref:DUF6279 family lipoprotein n=1 Tax=Polaromonas sp. TaxID=1869339 RepID=UPI00286B72D8|nr:DUF6279 family lipoprotein [Polaromonas sp.]
MNFPESFLRGAAWARAGRFLGLRRIIGLLAVACLLQACSAVRIVYNQAPELAYLYLDRQLDLSDAQTLQVKDELGKLQAWHRKSQLPVYVEALQKLQQRLPADMAPEQACALWADAKQKLMTVAEQAQPAAAQVVGTLGARQLAHLERRFAKMNAEFRDDYLDGPPQKSRDKRYEQTVNRAEMLYGGLEEKQLAVLGQQADQSRFDAQLSYAEKLRRQQDLLQTLRPLIAGQAAPEKIQLALRGLTERALVSPNPVYRDYMAALTQQGCRSFAELHNSSTPEQRGKAVQKLGSYARHFKALGTQRP